VTEPKYPDIYVPLAGRDGNAFSVIGRVLRALHKAGVSKEEQDTYWAEAMSGDYDHLLQTTLAWVSEGSDDE